MIALFILSAFIAVANSLCGQPCQGGSPQCYMADGCGCLAYSGDSSKFEKFLRKGNYDECSVEQCGSTTCDVGDVCCNESCGICTAPGGSCTQQHCESASNPIMCGSNQCADGEYCCNESCGICAPNGGHCTQQFCVDSTTTQAPGPVTCGSNTCADGEYCCNESCGICAPMGGSCTQQFCTPTTTTGGGGSDSSETVIRECPAEDEATDFIGDNCHFAGQCEYDEIQCCGETVATTICSCQPINPSMGRYQCASAGVDCSNCPTTTTEEPTATCGGFDNCATYYDGCNTCQCMDNGEESCTEKSCYHMGQSRCKMCKDGFELKQGECVEQVLQHCPAEDAADEFIGDSCHFSDSCEYEEIQCCGETIPTKVCSCDGGSFQCASPGVDCSNCPTTTGGGSALRECPVDNTAVMSGDSCDFSEECGYEPIECCGESIPTTVCSCDGGKYLCIGRTVDCSNCPTDEPVTCGDNTCADGEFCCNESCGICAPMGGVCTQQFCGPSGPEMCCTANAGYSNTFSTCEAVMDDYSDAADQEKYCTQGGGYGSSDCKYVPCSEVGYCVDKDDDLYYDEMKAFEIEEAEDMAIEEADSEEALDADYGRRTPRTPRPAKTPRPRPTRPPRPTKTPRPTKEPRTPRPTNTPRPTRGPKSTPLKGCAAITDKAMCGGSGYGSNDCVWKEGYPPKAFEEDEYYQFVSGLNFEFLNDMNSNVVMMIAVLFIAALLFGYKRYSEQKVKSVYAAPEPVYGSCQA